MIKIILATNHKPTTILQPYAGPCKTCNHMPFTTDDYDREGRNFARWLYKSVPAGYLQALRDEFVECGRRTDANLGREANDE